MPRTRPASISAVRRSRPRVLADALEAELEDAGHFGGGAVEVTPVPRAGDPPDESLLAQEPGVGADAGLADVERLGELVEGAGLVPEKEERVQAAPDAGHAIGLEMPTYAFDELLFGRRHPASPPIAGAESSCLSSAGSIRSSRKKAASSARPENPAFL
jgi:hypothetical protein